MKSKITGGLNYCLGRLYNEGVTPSITNLTDSTSYLTLYPEEFAKNLKDKNQIKISARGDFDKSKLVEAVQKIKKYFK